jgi:hypothetical protein
VKYDSAIKVRRDTIDSRDITVTGPNGYNRLGKLYWIDKTINHVRLYARYKISAPNGFWLKALVLWLQEAPNGHSSSSYM